MTRNRNTKDEYGDPRRVEYIATDGPFSAGIDRSGSEYPEWTVSVMDDDDCEIEVMAYGAYSAAQAHGEQLAREYGVEMVNDASPFS